MPGKARGLSSLRGATALLAGATVLAIAACTQISSGPERTGDFAGSRHHGRTVLVAELKDVLDMTIGNDEHVASTRLTHV